MSKLRYNDKSDIGAAALWVMLSVAVPSAVMTAMMAFSGITPFGDSTLINEANAAWFEGYTGMYRSIISGEGIFYHLNVGFGSGFYHVFASGLCSPFLFLSFFFGQRWLAAAFSVITIVRTGAAGASAWYMLRKCSGLGRCMCFALSCGYSLCGFAAFAAYYPSVADGAVFFPLLVSGIYSFVQESRPIRLFVFGGLFFFTCPRLSLLGMLISCAFFSAFYFRRGSRRQRVYKTAMFAATLLCSCAINAVFVLPVWAGSLYYKNGAFSDVPQNDIVSDLCFGGFGTTSSGGIGLCLSGLLIMGFCAFMFNTRMRWEEKVSAACGAALLTLCHAVPPLAKIALGFGNADGESVSAGFMLALLFVYCTARNHVERDGIEIWGMVCSMGVYAALALVSLALRGNDVFSVLAEAGLAVLSCAVFTQLFVSDAKTVRLPAVTAAALLLFGGIHCAGAVGRIRSEVTASRLGFVADSRQKAREELEASYREKNEEIPRFYRTRSTDGVSDSVDLNRNEVAGVTEFAERLGIMRNSQFGGADNFTVFTDLLFGIANTDFGYYSKEDALSKACSPAYLIGDWDNELPKDMNAFELQNYLAGKWFGVQLFETVLPAERTTEKSSESERYKWTFGNESTVVDRYVFELSEGERLYMLVPDADYSYAVNGDSRSDWRKACAGGIYSLNGSGDGKPVTAFVSYDASCGTPEPVFMSCSKNLEKYAKSKCAEYISFRGSKISFLFDTDRAQTAFTSIPYESGWEITVNGEKVRPVELCGGLIGIRLEKGRNSVVMSYTPPYFRMSLWISLILLAVGSYITLKVEHEAARRRKVRMAFRAVELDISRMTAPQTETLPEDVPKTDARQADANQADAKQTDAKQTDAKQAENLNDITKSEVINDEKV